MDNLTGKKIKFLRQKIGVNQEAIAKLLGISVPAYSKIESGITDVNLSRLKQISKVFHVNATDLLDDNQEQKEKDVYILQLREDLKVANEEIIALQRKLIRYYTEANG